MALKYNGKSRKESKIEKNKTTKRKPSCDEAIVVVERPAQLTGTNRVGSSLLRSPSVVVEEE